uniref:Multimerin 2a n=1 Tax=Amphiprion percula TaxID=161767 RepID=A0A3P8SMU9_AMPPE
MGGTGSYPSRTGNWCPFVQDRVVTTVVVCGTEKYTIRSQSPCPSGSPNCQLVMYKLSTRPIYKEKPKIVTSLLWRCCPGHGGRNCEDTVSDPQLDSGSLGLITVSEPERIEVQAPAVDEVVAATLPYPDVPAALPVPHMMALVMSQLQPVLEGFNRSLEHLSRQVGDLARDMAQLKSSQLEAELQAGPPEGVEEPLEDKLDEAFHHIRELRRQVESQRSDMENRLHSQHAMLHYNLTSFKTDIDMKLKRHQKMLQVSLQTINATLSELKFDQDQITEDEPQDHLPPPSPPPPRPPPPSDTSALWEAIERLDNMVVNNTVKVNGLTEDVEGTSGSVQQLRQHMKELEKLINNTARKSQVLFMETGLEVEDAKVSVLRRVDELAGNLTQQDQRLQEMDVDVDYLYTILYKHNTTTDCDCKALKAAVARLERGVANVTELANENRLALEENSEGGAGQWGGASDWEPVVEALQHGLQQVKESLNSEQTTTRILNLSLTQLSDSVSGLTEADIKLNARMEHLSASFNSLLKDAIRHSEVLELLLGEEVLEFLDWPLQEQEANSVPVLKEQLRQLQEQLKGHDENIRTLQSGGTGVREEVPSADQPPSSSSSSNPLQDDWLPGDMRRSISGLPARERQLLLQGSDLWNLEKTVEELQQKLLRLEERPCPCPNISTNREAPPGGLEAKLQAEVMWLKRGLEEHLRVFKNVFSNADRLVGAEVTLDLDKLFQLLKNKDEKKDRKRGGGREESGRGGRHRNRRDSSGVSIPSDQSEGSLLFVAGSPVSVSNSGIIFEPSLNRGHIYSDGGTFTAPGGGLYLFLLTLDLRPGPAHVVLRRGQGGGAAVSLQRRNVAEAGLFTSTGLLLLREGEEVRLELKEGQWEESEDNVFAGLLLHRTT